MILVSENIKKNLKVSITVLFLLLQVSFFAQSAKKVSVIGNYKNWKWDSVFVAKNKYISLAVVPKAGGRILEYNLGEIASLWVNPEMLGKSFMSSDEVKKEEWRNFGGYRIVPIPISNCAVGVGGEKIKRWPPPAILGDSPYSAKISNENGEDFIEVASGIQKLPVPSFDFKSQSFVYPEKIDEELQYKRRLRIEENSSLVYIEHMIFNRGNEAVKRGIMSSSQHISRSNPELTDGKNFCVYIPFDKKYRLPNGDQYEITGTAETRWQFVNRNRKSLDKNNPEHVKLYYNNGTNWTGEVAPGVFEIHYDYDLMSGFHMISSDSWVSYVNKLNNTAFVKILEPYNSKLEYEDGTNLSIYNSALSSGYLETEVRTPIYSINPGAYASYTEIHAAAKIASVPVLSVNRSGIITRKMNFNGATKRLSGQFGVFFEGVAVLQLLDGSEKKVKEIVLEDVNPLKAFLFDIKLNNSSEVANVLLQIKDRNNNYHLLDSAVVVNK
ncbi:hypothetical protein SLW70_15735 [Flavobacterium sp. NG2]|uniref:hypothetical protein n=1 Tax=Flavobacterium sp. NG2 TaxID=3097547 RepID=UPI002A805E99|nr:hypothetical protein [Flavobacterium sp. NG2]WPR71365.1 hypothetical protein SLW70_15735 [Flavobacterium sp. NG2]